LAFGNDVNAAMAAGLLNRRPHGPNLVRVPCETEENEQSSLRLTPAKFDRLHSYVQWQHLD